MLEYTLYIIQYTLYSHAWGLSGARYKKTEEYLRDSRAVDCTTHVRCDPYCGPISVTVSPVWPLSSSTIYRFIWPDLATILFAHHHPPPDISHQSLIRKIFQEKLSLSPAVRKPSRQVNIPTMIILLLLKEMSIFGD